MKLWSFCRGSFLIVSAALSMGGFAPQAEAVPTTFDFGAMVQGQLWTGSLTFDTANFSTDPSANIPPVYATYFLNHSSITLNGLTYSPSVANIELWNFDVDGLYFSSAGTHTIFIQLRASADTINNVTPADVDILTHSFTSVEVGIDGQGTEAFFRPAANPGDPTHVSVPEAGPTIGLLAIGILTVFSPRLVRHLRISNRTAA